MKGVFQLWPDLVHIHLPEIISSISGHKEKVRVSDGPILNKIQTGLKDVPVCHVTISSLRNLNRLTCFQSSRRSEKISRNRASSSTNCHGNDTHHVAVHESYQTATLEHKLSIVEQI